MNNYEDWTSNELLLDQLTEKVVLALNEHEELQDEVVVTETQMFWFISGWVGENVKFATNNQLSNLRFHLTSRVEKALTRQ